MHSSILGGGGEASYRSTQCVGGLGEYPSGNILILVSHLMRFRPKNLLDTMISDQVLGGGGSLGVLGVWGEKLPPAEPIAKGVFVNNYSGLSMQHNCTCGIPSIQEVLR